PPAVSRRPPAARRLACHLVALLVATLVSATFAQVSVPTFGTRGTVADETLSSFMTAFRSAVSAATGLEVTSGERITSGIAGSLDPELAMLIAEVDSARYAISGELARVDEAGPATYTVNLVVVDRSEEHTSELQSRENLV